MALHNRINGKLLKEQIAKSKQKRSTLSFYKYVKITNPSEFRDTFYKELEALGVLGRIYVAQEGINAQISVPNDTFDLFQTYLQDHALISDVRLNLAIQHDSKSFFKLKIQVKDKIVADGLNDRSFDVTKGGKHLSAADFNHLTQDPSTIVVDMRNHYESEVGHFRDAVLPDVDTFREALLKVENMLNGQEDKNIILYCTGGIRCEKASAYYKHKGFTKVYQLDGGIIEYARQVEKNGLKNRFVGKNFVFDERLGERITDEVISRCHQCGESCDSHTNCKNDGCHLLFIQCERCAQQYKGCCSTECTEIIELPADAQKTLRQGISKGRQVYRKGRSEKLLFKR